MADIQNEIANPLLSNDYTVVKEALLSGYRDGSLGRHALISFKSAELSIEDSFRLYAELRDEIDGDKILYCQPSGELFDIGGRDWLNEDQFKSIVSKYVNLDDPNPLMSFVEREVLFRIRNLYGLDIVEEDVLPLIDIVKENTDVMFDYGRFDNFLVEEYAKLKGLDRVHISQIKGEISNLRHELDGASEFDPDLVPKIDKRLFERECQLTAAEKGANINVSVENLIDGEHLNCLWYGGPIGTIEYKGYTISVEVHGDVNVSVLSEDGKDVLFSYKNKNNTGIQPNDDIFMFVDNDLELETLDNEGRLAWENNNWVEFFVFDKSGRSVDVPFVETIMVDNVLEALSDVEFFIDVVDRIDAELQQNNRSSGLFIFDDELLLGENHETINGYLWALDGLVDRLLDSQEMENINFYADYNVLTGEVKLTSTFDTPSADGELNKTADVPLSDDEKTELISAMNEYCQKTAGMSCFELVNRERVEDGLEPLVLNESKPALDHLISFAEQKVDLSTTNNDSFAMQR